LCDDLAAAGGTHDLLQELVASSFWKLQQLLFLELLLEQLHEH
jgi:hypothetical protein